MNPQNLQPTRTCGIVVAGGSGERTGRVGGKQIATVAGCPVVAWSIQALDEAGLDHIVVVCPASRHDEYRECAIEPFAFTTPITFAPSGDTRQASVASGLAATPAGTRVVVVHDGARPLVSPQTVCAAVEKLTENPDAAGVVVGHPSVDTLKLVEDGRIVSTIDRRTVWSAQTPQVFWLDALEAAHRAHDAAGSEESGTDDSVLVERIGKTVLVLEGPRTNIKVTLPEDFGYVEAALLERARGEE